MKLMTFGRPAMYLRNDPDAGWTLALWKWRVFFNVVTGASSQEGGSLVSQLRGRAKSLRTRGEVKTPELLERAADRLEKAG